MFTVIQYIATFVYENLSRTLVTAHCTITVVTNLLNTLSWLKYTWEWIKARILCLTDFKFELFTIYMRMNARILYPISFNYYLSQYYATFWNNNFNVTIVFHICKGEASSWNNFLFYVHYNTTWWWPIKYVETCCGNIENMLHSYQLCFFLNIKNWI